MNTPLLLLATVFLATAAPTTAQGTVHVVDQSSGPGTDFTTIGAAIGAARNGDTILVRSGSYFEFIAIGGIVPSKSLVVAADAGADVRVSGILVANQTEGETLVVRGIDVEPLPQNGFVYLVGCAGTVWLEDVEGLDGFGGDGVLVQDAASVVLSRCRFSDAFSLDGTVTVQDSHVAIFDSTLETGLNAVHGLRVHESDVLVSGGRIEGSDGFDAVPGTPCIPATPGQPAVLQTGSGAQLTLLGADLVGGRGGQGDGGDCTDASDGPTVQVLGGTVRQRREGARSLEISSPARTGEGVTLTFLGEPGDVVGVRLAQAPRRGSGGRPVVGWDVLESPSVRVFLGVVPASGRIDFVTNAGPTGGADSVHLFAQGFALLQRELPTSWPTGARAFQGLVASSPTTLLILAPGL